MKYEITTMRTILYKIPVEAETKEEAFDLIYNMSAEEQAKYEYDDIDTGFDDTIEEID